MVLIILNTKALASTDVIDKCEFIDCDTVEKIVNPHLFFIKSKHGFIHTRKTGTPLHDAVPMEIGMTTRPLPGEEISVDTIVVQEIITKLLKGKIFEGGMPSRPGGPIIEKKKMG